MCTDHGSAPTAKAASWRSSAIGCSRGSRSRSSATAPRRATTSMWATSWTRPSGPPPDPPASSRTWVGDARSRTSSCFAKSRLRPSTRASRHSRPTGPATSRTAASIQRSPVKPGIGSRSWLCATESGASWSGARDGASSVVDDQGGVWRMYTYIENGVPVVGAPSGREVGRAAGAYGAFQRALADLPGPRLHETIPHFHDTPRRLEALERAVESDAAARAASVRAEIDQIRGCRHLAPLLVDAAARGAVPERVVHNDAKLANVLFDAASGDALCVVDLDTVMPGLALYDFGDLVRSMATRAAEDERDISRVRLEPELFESVACGYIAATRELLTQAERELLVPAAQVIVYEQAARFLIDHLEGDRYYRIARPGHNLDRCRTQLALLDALRAGERALQQIVTHM